MSHFVKNNNKKKTLPSSLSWLCSRSLQAGTDMHSKQLGAASGQPRKLAYPKPQLCHRFAESQGSTLAGLWVVWDHE